MNETVTRPPDAAPASGSFPAAVLIAILVAFADVQFVQWTSFTMRPALVGFSLALDAALLLAVGILLAAVVHILARQWRSFQQLSVHAVFAGVAVVWLFSRARLATLQSVGPATVFVVVPAIVVLFAVLGVTARGLRGEPLSRRVELVAVWWVGAALLWLGYLWSEVGAAPYLLAALVVLTAGLNGWWVARAGDAGTRVRLAGLVVLNALILIASFPLAPGFDRPQRTEAAASAQAVGPTPEGSPGSPNVILIVLDTLRADHMSTYGYEYDTTPRLDAFAETASVFEPGFANATWSLPSHASLLTGLLPHQHGAHAALRATSPSPSGGPERDASAQGRATGSFSFAQRPLGAEHETLAELLASRGYSTAAIVANFGWVSEFFGLLQGFEYVDNRPMNLFSWEPVAAPYLRRLGWERLNERYVLLNKSAFFADSIVEHVREWEGQRPPAPFFLLLNFMDAHAPFRASLMTEGFPGRLPDLDATGDEQSYSMARYDRSIAYLDRQVGELFEFLRSRGLFDDSLIVVTSDHGENFDDNRPAAHGADLLQATVAVPLIIKLPNQREGSRPGRVGQLIDVVPTVREVLGLEVGEAMFGSPMGRSPRAVIAENYFSALFGAYAAEFEGTEEEMLAAFPSRWVLLEGPWKLERLASGASRRFDLAVDPKGLVDVSGEYLDVSAKLEQRLNELLPETAFTTARFPSTVGLPDRQTIDRLRSLGYLR